MTPHRDRVLASIGEQHVHFIFMRQDDLRVQLIDQMQVDRSGLHIRVPHAVADIQQRLTLEDRAFAQCRQRVGSIGMPQHVCPHREPNLFLDGFHRIYDGAFREFRSKLCQNKRSSGLFRSLPPHFSLVYGIGPHVFHERPRHVHASGLAILDVHVSRLQINADHLPSSPTTHIAKPDSRLEKYQPSAINEYLCMKLAHEMRLSVPRVDLIQVPETLYVVERYDRAVVKGAIVCLHQIDACQLLGVGADWKYERQGGLVSLKKIVDAFRGLMLSGKDLLSVQRWVMFNYLIGNSDAHAKNISLMVNSQGYELAPFYDLLCVQAYGDNDLALFIGDESTYDAVGSHSWEAFCEDCGFGFKPTMRQFRKMAEDIGKSWEKIVTMAISQHQINESERALIERIGAVIDANSKAALSMTAA